MRVHGVGPGACGRRHLARGPRARAGTASSLRAEDRLSDSPPAKPPPAAGIPPKALPGKEQWPTLILIFGILGIWVGVTAPVAAIMGYIYIRDSTRAGIDLDVMTLIGAILGACVTAAWAIALVLMLVVGVLMALLQVVFLVATFVVVGVMILMGA